MELWLLDGAESIGGTKLYLDPGRDRPTLLIDFGINYKRWGHFFEEYLQPRDGRGLHDLLKMGLAPRVNGIYRRDLCPCDLKLPDGEDEHLEPALCLVSHAHFDHCGLLGLLHEGLPIATSPLSAAIMKAAQDLGQTKFYGEMAYVSPRKPYDDEPRVVQSDRRGTYKQRHWLLFADSTPEALKGFLRQPPGEGSRAKGLAPAPIASLPHAASIEGLQLRVWPVDHSIPGACAFAIETDAGWVVYTGDLRFHGAQGALTERFVREAAQLKPTLLILEGTRAHGDLDENPTAATSSEADVYGSALEAVRRAQGRLVVADFGARHVERLEIFLKIAEETGRKLLMFAKDAYLLQALAYADPRYEAFLKHPAWGIFDEVKLQPSAGERRIREAFHERLVRAGDVQRTPGSFLLAFSFWDLKHLLDLDPAGGVYIYSSSEAHTEEQQLDLERLLRWIERFGMEPVGLRRGPNGQPEPTAGYHASGHASGEDLLEIARRIRPEKLLPVHTEHPGFFLELQGEMEVLLARDGERLRLP